MDLDFGNTLVVYEEPENPSLDRYKKTMSSGGGGAISGGRSLVVGVGVVVGLVMVAAAI